MGVFSLEIRENCSWWQLLTSAHRNSRLGQDFPEGPAALALPRTVLLESCPRVPAAGSPRSGSVRERVSLRDRRRWPMPRHARCPLGMLALHPWAAQPGDASGAARVEGSTLTAVSGGKSLKCCLLTSISFFPFIVRSYWLSVVPHTTLGLGTAHGSSRAGLARSLQGRGGR